MGRRRKASQAVTGSQGQAFPSLGPRAGSPVSWEWWEHDLSPPGPQALAFVSLRRLACRLALATGAPSAAFAWCTGGRV